MFKPNVFVQELKQVSLNIALLIMATMWMCDISAEDAREIIACLQHALDVNEKGGQNEK